MGGQAVLKLASAQLGILVVSISVLADPTTVGGWLTVPFEIAKKRLVYAIYGLTGAISLDAIWQPNYPR